jgi:hypothetical protein
MAFSKAASVDYNYRSDDSASEKPTKQAEPAATGNAATNTKRKYRRHPKPDENAPERPPSAYVIFSNQMREQLKGQDLTFTEIAKVVGERWQVLEPELREQCERQANIAKENYYRQLAIYKKTPEYESYQKYLEDFKAKHGVVTQKDGKRSKLEVESATTNNAMEQNGHSTDRKTQSVQVDPYSMSHYRPDNNHSIAPGRLPSAPLYPSKPTSPALYPMSVDSPRTVDQQYSPRATSPRTTTHDFPPSPLGTDSRRQVDGNMSYTPSLFGPSQPISSTSPPVYPGGYHNGQIDLPARRTFREPVRLPALTHEETTLSSDSGALSSSSHLPATYVPQVDPQKSMRVLPQPVPSIGPSPSGLDRHYPRTLEALVRAGEMARADDEAAKKPPDS